MLTPDQIAALLKPYEIVPRGTIAGAELFAVDWNSIHQKLAVYLELILKWNSRTNLTAIRQPEEIVRRHFGESLFTGLQLYGGQHPAGQTLLDFGSGAGFPGLPIQLLYPGLRVTLAESQGKKAAFLREACRALGVNCEVWSNRVEAMPADRRFDVVTLRAVDDMDAAIRQGAARATSHLAVLTTDAETPEVALPDFRFRSVALPGSKAGLLVIGTRT